MVGDGGFASVFRDETLDPSFGVTTRIVLVRRTLAGSVLASYAPGPGAPVVTSFAPTR